ncbi:hypothetical protein [Streptomyces pactum]|uniref:Uncharacterized protein n=1 Tax=Streptomyces pactum TaxID=68249 RepID=A0A1S6JCQ1_9ACTN|nr:hypothetical protein [Streptomyces pactum]AQS69538.1 hypothetical protein B1H29_23960 [Streptomyces pactum]
MKPLKVAAVIVGSVIASGAAAPAFAHNAGDLAPTSLNNGTATPFKNVSVLDIPLDDPMNVIDNRNGDSPLYTVADAKNALNGNESLQRGLSLQG